jgi:hypothetical protein
VRVDVTEGFPFLVTKMSPYYHREINIMNMPGFTAEASLYQMKNYHRTVSSVPGPGSGIQPSACRVQGHEECDVMEDWVSIDGQRWVTGHHLENCRNVIDSVDCSGDGDGSHGGGGPGGGGDGGGPSEPQQNRRCVNTMRGQLQICQGRRYREDCEVCVTNAWNVCAYHCSVGANGYTACTEISNITGRACASKPRRPPIPPVTNGRAVV